MTTGKRACSQSMLKMTLETFSGPRRKTVKNGPLQSSRPLKLSSLTRETHTHPQALLKTSGGIKIRDIEPGTLAFHFSTMAYHIDNEYSPLTHLITNLPSSHESVLSIEFAFQHQSLSSPINRPSPSLDSDPSVSALGLEE